MEEEFDVIFENITISGSTPSYLFVHDGFCIFFAIIGIIADVLIIYMIASNKKMKTNSNLILMNWAISDVLILCSSVLNSNLMLRLLRLPQNSRVVNCMLIDLDSICHIMVTTFVFALISKSSFQYTMKVNIINMVVFYFTMLLVLIVSLVSCNMNVNFMLLPLAAVLLYLALFFMVLIKEDICRCCGNKTEPLSEEMSVRFNVARIYTYYSMVSIFFYILVEISEPGFIRIICQFFYMLGYISSVFVVIYLGYADKKFQICLLNLLRKREDQYNVDATIGFSEEDNIEDDVEAVLGSAHSVTSENNQDQNNKEVQLDTQ